MEHFVSGTGELAHEGLRAASGSLRGFVTNKVTDVLGYQLLKVTNSIGANYREANRAVSHSDFINQVVPKLNPNSQ